MKKRREDCKYCGEKLTEGNTNRQFCCTLHRVYWHRENPKTKVQDLTKPTNVVRPQEITQSNYSINTDQIATDQAELAGLGVGGVADQRRRFLLKRIKELKRP